MCEREWPIVDVLSLTTDTFLKGAGYHAVVDFLLGVSVVNQVMRHPLLMREISRLILEQHPDLPTSCEVTMASMRRGSSALDVWLKGMTVQHGTTIKLIPFTPEQREACFVALKRQRNEEEIEVQKRLTRPIRFTFGVKPLDGETLDETYERAAKMFPDAASYEEALHKELIDNEVKRARPINTPAMDAFIAAGPGSHVLGLADRIADRREAQDIDYKKLLVDACEAFNGGEGELEDFPERLATYMSVTLKQHLKLKEEKDQALLEVARLTKAHEVVAYAVEDPEDGVELFDGSNAKEEAEKFFDDAIESYQGAASSDGWHENTERLALYELRQLRTVELVDGSGPDDHKFDTWQVLEVVDHEEVTTDEAKLIGWLADTVTLQQDAWAHEDCPPAVSQWLMVYLPRVQGVAQRDVERLAKQYDGKADQEAVRRALMKGREVKRDS